MLAGARGGARVYIGCHGTTSTLLLIRAVVGLLFDSAGVVGVGGGMVAKIFFYGQDGVFGGF